MSSPQIETTSGRIAGRREGGVEVFLGIPFAAPTGGANRFLPPRPVVPWRGVRDATAAGPAAPQAALDAGALPGMEVGAQSEDCLSLNVYTPAADGGRRPVMVWIHGGVVGDDLLPRPPLEAVRAGSAAGASMLIGTTSDEWSLFGFMDPGLESLDDAGFASRAEARAGADGAPRVVEAYRKQAPAGTPTEHFVALETDFVFRVPALRLADAQARHAPVYVYEFAWRSPAQGGALGACHAIDLPFVFGTLDAPGVAAFAGSGGDAERLRDAAMDAWVGFARGANPHDAPLPDWPRHDPETRPSLVFDREIRVALARRDASFRAWEGLR